MTLITVTEVEDTAAALQASPVRHRRKGRLVVQDLKSQGLL
jgi:hypothetical protein